MALPVLSSWVLSLSILCICIMHTTAAAVRTEALVSWGPCLAECLFAGHLSRALLILKGSCPCRTN